jgi:hypothetical protein
VSTTGDTAIYRTQLERIIETEGRKQRWLLDRVNEIRVARGLRPISRSLLSAIVGGYHADDVNRAAIAQVLGRQVDEVFPAEAA